MQTVGEFEYSTSNLLGHGAFALVFMGRRIKDHQPVAIKQITLKNVPGKLSNIRQKEIQILKGLCHLNIVQLYDYLETPADVFLVMEYCNGGDMGDYLIAKKTLSEDSIKILVRHIAGALEVLVNNQIIHRDIKPHNLLLSYPVANGGSLRERSFRDVTVKLADFGFARHLSATDMAATLCGSPLYMAPEILLGHRYDNKADLWSVGTILFQCLSGTAPFLASNPHALRKKYDRENLVPNIPSGTSHLLSQLLLSLLKKDPNERLAYRDFFTHPFLMESTSVALDSSPQLSLHIKSSPVPIRRHTHQTPFGLSTSPVRRGSSAEVYSFSPSSASGPPLNHHVGSHNSNPYYSTQKSDIIDQGFIVVDLPGASASRRFGRSNSLSISQSPASYISAHTPSSAGSLTRYASLTTPFYRVPTSPVNDESVPVSSGTTPTNTDVRAWNGSSGYHSHTHLGSYTSLSRSNSGHRKSNSSCHVPFGQLIQHVTQVSVSSPVSISPLSQSPHCLSLPKSNSPSPLPTPPSSLPPVTAQRNISGGMRYAYTPSGSTSKLSSLAEEKEVQGGNRHSQCKTYAQRRGNSPTLFTQSCLLQSDDEDVYSVGEGKDDEDSFLPLSLTMSFNSSHGDQRDGVDTEYSKSVDTNSTKLTAVSQETVKFSVGIEVNEVKGGGSLSAHHNPRLRQELAEIHTKASTLGFRKNCLNQDYKATPTGKESDGSECPDIVEFQMPFVFPLSKDTVSSPCGSFSRHWQDHLPRPRLNSDILIHPKSSLLGDLATEKEGLEVGGVCPSELKSDLLLGRELLAMAQARQGPIMLLSTSTSLNDSGIGNRVQRLSEQLVLYAKAVSVLKSSLLVNEIKMATKSIEPSHHHKEVESECHKLADICLEKVKSIREQLVGYISKNGFTRVSAEKLLYLEALDMCKAAMLDEKSGKTKECIKRYRRAKLIFQHLLDNAHTHHDKSLLKKYVLSSQSRLGHLTIKT